MHIIKTKDLDGYYDISYCDVKVGILDNAYQSVDNSIEAIINKKGSYVCQKCLKEVNKIIQESIIL